MRDLNKIVVEGLLLEEYIPEWYDEPVSCIYYYRIHNIRPVYQTTKDWSKPE